MVGKEASNGASSRIVFITDMEVCEEDGVEFCQIMRTNAQHTLWTTVIGVGHDLAKNVISDVSSTPGCSYASVATSSDFQILADKEFAFWVTPIAFNISLSLSNGNILEGFGSPEAAAVKVYVCGNVFVN